MASKPTSGRMRARLWSSKWNSALVEQVAVTPANVNDAGRPASRSNDIGEMRAATGTLGEHLARIIRQDIRSGATVVATAMWGCDEQETLARLDAWNAPIHHVRARIEKIFGTWEAQL